MNRFGRIEFYDENGKKLRTNDVITNQFNMTFTVKKTKEDWLLCTGQQEYSFNDFKWRFSEETTLKAILTGFTKETKDGRVRMCNM